MMTRAFLVNKLQAFFDYLPTIIYKELIFLNIFVIFVDKRILLPIFV